MQIELELIPLTRANHSRTEAIETGDLSVSVARQFAPVVTKENAKEWTDFTLEKLQGLQELLKLLSTHI